MLNILKSDSDNLVNAKELAIAMAYQRGHDMYVVHLCDDDYDVTAQVPKHYVYKAKP